MKIYVAGFYRVWDGYGCDFGRPQVLAARLGKTLLSEQHRIGSRSNSKMLTELLVLHTEN